MSHPTTEELKKSTNVVLKLSLDKGNQTQLRRIPLARLWEDGKASYKRLVDLMLEYSSKENPHDDEEEMKVEITYLDEDGDTIHISSDEELTDAFTQFVDTKPPVLRAKGQLVRKTKVPQQTTTQTRAAPSSQREHNNSSSSSKDNILTKDKLKDLMQNAQKIVLESKDDIMDSSDLLVNTESFKAVAAVAKETVMDVMENAKSIVLETEKAKSAHPQPQNESEEPFLHGRHTCDKCLCAPIVGTRYHATNKHDFDLCENCFKAFEGDDIHFQPEVCERDRPMQKRWQRRQARRLRQARFSGGEYPGSCRRSNRRRHCHFKSSNENTDKRDEFSDSLKEAIRRSLEDLKAEKEASVNKKDEKQQPSATEDSEVDKEKAMKEDFTEMQEANDTKQKAENVTEPKLEENESKVEKNESKVEKNESKVEEDESKAEEDESKAEEDESKAEEDESKAEEDAPKVEDNEQKIEENGPKLEENEPKTGENPENNEESNDTLLNGRNDYHGILESLGVISKKITNPVVESNDFVDLEVNNIDAENGSIVASVSTEDDKNHETKHVPNVPVPDLDIVSGKTEEKSAIIKVPVADIKEQEVDIKEPEIVDATVVPHEEENTSIEDAKIQQEVAPIESQQQSEAEVDDWDVVDEADDIQEQIAGDEALARAASLIGSALFQSDLSDSMLGRQTTNSTQVSTTSPLSSAVLARWEIELNQLHDLGFLDDVVNVDALESLQAANIGADSDDIVSVNDAVLRILSNN